MLDYLCRFHWRYLVVRVVFPGERLPVTAEGNWGSQMGYTAYHQWPILSYQTNIKEDHEKIQHTKRP